MRTGLMLRMTAVLPLLAGTNVQTQDWRFDATSHLWFPDTKTRMALPRGPAVSKLSASDARKTWMPGG